MAGKKAKKAKKAKKKTKTRKKAAAPRRQAKKISSAIVSDVEMLIDMMAANGITEVDITDGSCRIALKRGGGAEVVGPAAVPVPHAAAVPAEAAAREPEAAEEAAEDLIDITSPIVGTFYAAPSPDSAPFVKKGDKVDEDNVVCIVEAMKVMNEIKAECNGTIAEVCVKNAEPVEFGQVMFRVRPA
jgi:acetyl-CoA carboxylase biotin carboxyl carrier protein